MQKKPSEINTVRNIIAPVFQIVVFVVASQYLSGEVAAFARTADAMQGTAEPYSCTGMSFSAVNCNSLNLSSANKPTQMKKIYAIAKMRSDVIFLSDIRLSKKSTSGCVIDLKNNFLTNPYESYALYFNSSMNKRGTGILIKSSLGISEINRYCDTDENFLVLLAESSKGKRVILASIYGPNSYKPQFFNALKNAVRNCGNLPVIIAGDWNCTVSQDPAADNIDCFNMAERVKKCCPPH